MPNTLSVGDSMLRAGTGQPLVLLHGVLGSARMWKSVMPLLAPDFDVIALTALGHRGGREVTKRPVQLVDMVDDAARSLDELGLDRVHFAGNSLGGWMALELARRGRALSVCALSPGGLWSDKSSSRARAMLRVIVRATNLSQHVIPKLGKYAWFRRLAMRDVALHGDRVTREELIEMSNDVLGCAAGNDLLNTHDTLAPLTVTCPITVAWSRADRIFPVAVHEPIARRLLPDAEFTVLEGVGHVPMIDDAALVADAIRRTARK